MNIYRNASNKIALSTFPSIEGGYILLRFTRGTSNVYAISPNIVSEEFPMVAQITEIGSGTPVPADGEVLLDAGKWTCYAYEQVSATNYNPDCPERFLEEIPINVFGDAAAVLNQTPEACPGADDVDSFFYLTSAAVTGIYRQNGTANGKAYFDFVGGTSGQDYATWDGGSWSIFAGGIEQYIGTDDVAYPTLVTTWITAAGALPLPTTSDLYTGTIQEVVEALAKGIGSAREYVALISQTGTDAPIATVIKNTLGGTLVWSYGTPGAYGATLSGAFSDGAVIIPFGGTATRTPFFDVNGEVLFYVQAEVSANTIDITVFDATLSPANVGFENIPIQIIAR